MSTLNLACHEDVCISLKWRGRNVGLFHHYPDAEPGETILEVFVESDWASDKTTRISVSCATMFVGGCRSFLVFKDPKACLFWAVQRLKFTHAPQVPPMLWCYHAWFHGWLASRWWSTYIQTVRGHDAFCNGKVRAVSGINRAVSFGSRTWSMQGRSSLQLWLVPSIQPKLAQRGCHAIASSHWCACLVHLIFPVES